MHGACIWIQAPYSVIQVHGVQNCAESVHQNGGQKSNADIRASFSLRFDYTLTKHLKTDFFPYIVLTAFENYADASDIRNGRRNTAISLLTSCPCAL